MISLSNGIQRLNDFLQASQKLVFFTGAGVSTDSGIPDFRSSQGIFMQSWGGEASPEEIISHDFFEDHPGEYFDFHFDKLVYPEAKPNAFHRFIADLERQGKSVEVVTQNIDGLHQEAGSSRVHELHGSVWRNYCQECGQVYDLSQLERDDFGVPRCSIDQGIVRPDIVLYGEPLDHDVVNQALTAVSEADLLLVAGTSLNVYPAAGYLDYFQGDQLIVVNKTPVQAHRPVDLILQMSVVDVVEKLQEMRN